MSKTLSKPVKRYQVQHAPGQLLITIPGHVSPRMRDVMLISLPLWVVFMWVLVEALIKALPALLAGGTAGRWFTYLFLAAMGVFWIWHGFTAARPAAPPGQPRDHSPDPR